MIAEIRGKINSRNTNLTEFKEDELTGNFFGNMRYIPFYKGMKKVLMNCIQPVEMRALIEEVEADFWADNLFLWERVREKDRDTELDVRLDFPSVIVGIEVKYQSGLSSKDGEDGQEISPENSRNQLSREARVLRQVGEGKKKLLLLLADEFSCSQMVQDIKLPSDVRLGYFSWQEVLNQIEQLTDLNDFEQLVVSDLIDLLKKKGFLRFSSFQIDVPDISDKDVWNFEIELTPTLEYNFSFVFDLDVMVEEGHYEFR